MKKLNYQDEKKFETLYITYKNLMMYIAQSIIHNKVMAEDIVQDSFIKLFFILDSIDNIKDYKTKALVTIITKRLSFNKLKYEKLRIHEKEEILQYINLKKLSMEEETIKKMYCNNILSELKKISNTDFKILILKYYYGYTYKDLEIFFNLSSACIRKRCERCKLKIKKKYNI